MGQEGATRPPLCMRACICVCGRVRDLFMGTGDIAIYQATVMLALPVVHGFVVGTEGCTYHSLEFPGNNMNSKFKAPNPDACVVLRF